MRVGFASLGPESLRVLTERLEEGYSFVDFVPGLGTYAGGAAEVDLPGTGLACLSFPNGATTSWKRVARTRKDWGHSGVRWTTWYTSDIGSTQTFSVSLLARGFGSGVNLAGLVDFLSVSTTWAGPAVAGDILEAVIVNGNPIVPWAYPWIGWRLVRTDPDNNANALRVLASRVEILPV